MLAARHSAARRLRVQGCLPDYVGITTALSQIAADLLQRRSRQSRALSWSGEGEVASCEIDKGIPSNGNTERHNKGRHRPEQYHREMQRQQRYAKSGKARNSIGQHGCRRTTADTMMQNEHDACVDNREHSKDATSRRTNSETQSHKRAD